MIKLNLTIPSKYHRHTLNQRLVPCHCLIGKRGFEIIFSKPVFDAIGIVDEWDEKTFDTIAPALAGGEYTHDECANLTLKLLEEGVYEIVELNLFSNYVGWISVIADSKYAEISM